MIILGIDPGIHGAIGVLGDPRGAVVVDMPGNPHDIIGELRWWAGAEPILNTFAVIEKQNARPGQGVSSTFQTGYGYGGLIYALAALSIPYEEVTPASWKQRMGLTKASKEETPAQSKARSRAMARQLWPAVEFKRVKDHGAAEALLIAEDYRRRRTQA